MLISLDWLNELIDLKTVNLEDLLETLTLGGFEVENSYELNFNNKKDTIIDINTTPNRSDTLSFKGIAKEIPRYAREENTSRYYLDVHSSWSTEGISSAYFSMER